jgi:hypothetical protein
MCPFVYVGMEMRIRPWDACHLRSRLACCFRLCVVWRRNRGVRGVRALLREEEGVGSIAVAVVVVEVLGGRV